MTEWVEPLATELGFDAFLELATDYLVNVKGCEVDLGDMWAMYSAVASRKDGTLRPEDTYTQRACVDYIRRYGSRCSGQAEVSDICNRIANNIETNDWR